MSVTYDGHIVHGNEVTGSLLIMSSNGANANTEELSPFTYCTSSGGSAKTQGKKFNMSTHENNTSSVKLHLSCLCFNKFIFILASYTTSNSSSTTRMIRLMIYLHLFFRERALARILLRRKQITDITLLAKTGVDLHKHTND